MIIPDSIRTNEGEIPIRQYNIAILRTWFKFQRAEGRIQVTNKRLLFRAAGRAIAGRTTMQHEYAVDEISGLEVRQEFRFDYWYFLAGSLLMVLFSLLGAGLSLRDSSSIGALIGILAGIGGLAVFFIINKKFWLKLIPLSFSLGGYTMWMTNGGGTGVIILAFVPFFVMLLCWVLFFMRPNLVISIKNKMGSGEGPVDIRRKTMKSESSGFLEVLPTEETEGAIREIGAIINDIQKLGDHGVRKWTNC